ncbi:MAG: 2-deoxystreptamine glucosyltransferase [Pelotomaculum sp. PtaB.Bin104]|nr:MAG: 2-deoxystreptamine glucosyltransferase [Pelotomaculum sp. PtaB.Bin104]
MTKEIWFINQYAVTPDLPGGSRHYDFGVELVRAGYTVRIFAATVNLALRRQVRNPGEKLWLEEPVDGILFEWIQTGTHRQNDWRRALGMLNFSWNVFNTGLRQGTRPHLIVGSSPQPLAALAGYCLARRMGCRFILEVRDLWPQALIDMHAVSAVHPAVWVLRWVERFLYRHSNKIIVLARGSATYLRKKGVPEERISYIPNGVHPGHCQTDRPREAARQLYGFNRFTVIYTGAHGPANALHTILEAAAEISNEPGIEFVLVGDGPAKPRLQAQAREMGLKNLRFAEPVPRNVIPELLLAADAAIIALKDAQAFYDAVSPNKLFDYLAAGKPVLCAAPGDMAAMVERHGCGLIAPPENGKALARQVRAMAALSEEQRRQMGAKGQLLVFNRFSRPKLVGKLIELLN